MSQVRVELINTSVLIHLMFHKSLIYNINKIILIISCYDSSMVIWCLLFTAVTCTSVVDFRQTA